MEAAASGGCGSGPPLLLSEGEQQCYSELFARCAGAAGGGPGSGPPEAARAAPGAATAASGPVADLFRASQLPAETLHQVGPRAPAPVGLWGPFLRGQGAGWGDRAADRHPEALARLRRGASQPGMAATPLSPRGHQPPPQLSSAGCAPHLPPLRLTDTPSPPRPFLGLCSRPDPKFALFWKWCLFWLMSGLTSARGSCPSLSWVGGRLQDWNLKGVCL